MTFVTGIGASRIGDGPGRHDPLQVPTERSPAVSGWNLLVTGRPGSGKTTVVRRTVELLRDRDVPVAGFYTAEVREDGSRVGFDLVTVPDGDRVPLARTWLDSPVTVGRYGVDVDAVRARGLPALDAPAGAVVVVDEIAPMETACPGFIATVEALLDADGDVLATIHARAGGATARIRNRDDVTLTDLSDVDRDTLPRRLADRLRPLA